jgi:alkylation response protein AidB-like acyl-CoA dehydrogenase
MDLNITDEQKKIQEDIITFCKKELNTKDGSKPKGFSRDLWTKCAHKKLTALPIDIKYGGAGLDGISTILALEAFGYGCEDGGLSFSVAAHLLATNLPIWKFGSESQKQQLVTALSNGSKIGANAITEHASGSDVFTMNTEAILKNEHYIINGNKTYISNGKNADIILLYAVTNKDKGYYGGITPFLIHSNEVGFNVEKDFEKMGLESCDMSELTFKNVKLDSNNILNEVGSGATIFNYSMEWERIGMSAIHIGIMQRIIEQTIEFTKNRQAQGELLSKKQAISHKIAEMKVRLEAGRMLTYKAALGLDKNKNNAIHASIAKLFVSESYIKTATDCVQIFGAAGYLKSNPIESVLRDSFASTLYSGTTEIQKNIIASILEL